MRYLILIVLCSCGPQLPTPTYTTPRGVQVYTGGLDFPADKATAMDDWLYKWLPDTSKHGKWFTQECIAIAQAQAYVWLKYDYFDCSGVEAAGCQAGTVLYLTFYNDPFNTAYIHEMIHLSQAVCRSPWDADTKHQETLTDGETVPTAAGGTRPKTIWDEKEAAKADLHKMFP